MRYLSSREETGATLLGAQAKDGVERRLEAEREQTVRLVQHEELQRAEAGHQVRAAPQQVGQPARGGHLQK